MEMQYLVEKAIKNEIFSGASIGILTENNMIDKYSYGNTDIYDGIRISDDIYFDLASLTKPLVTSLSIAALIDKKLLKLNSTLDEFYPAIPNDKKNISIGQLLNHRSGLLDHIKFYEKELTKNEIIEEILFSKLVDKPNKKEIYSDLGYILLGAIIEIVSGDNLANFWNINISKPLKLNEYFKFSGDIILNNNNCVSTVNIVDKNVKYCGEVHDDNCRLLGGCAGHAGLFGSIKGILKLLKSLTNSYHNKVDLPFCSFKIIEQIWKKENINRFTYGFDTPSREYSSSGIFFSRNSVGHLGFTGTSFWVDLERSIVIVLLTNRAISPDSLRDMKLFRPKFHDLIMKELV
ncbi:MAG: beta-lactamase family protein [Desulfotalea sp.]